MTTKLSDLREAIDVWEDFLHSAHGCDWDEPVAVAILHVNEAARRFLALAETGPDYEAAMRVLRDARPQWTEFVGDPFVVENIVDAALADYLTEEGPMSIRYGATIEMKGGMATAWFSTLSAMVTWVKAVKATQQ